MSRIVRWTRALGLLSLGAAATLAGCDAPTALPDSALAPVDAAIVQAKKTGLEPSVTPLCPGRFDANHALCLVDVNVKHGNDKGLPVNLNGIRNGNQLAGNGSGSELTVSVLGTLEFDLSAVYMNTLRLGDVQTLPPETPVTLLKNGKYQASIVDLNGDGILDLMLHFDIPTMVNNGDLSETTVKLCLYGEGPGYVLNGCGVGGGGNGGGEPPPYTLLPDCNFTPANKPASGFRCAVIELYGRDKPEPASVLQIGAWYVQDANAVYPSWSTLPETSLTGWESAHLPLASQDPYAAAQTTYDVNGNGIYEPFLTECSLTENPYRWASFGNILVRKDITVPQGATNVRIEFLVDDLARVYFNGVNLTGVGQGDGWATSGAINRCVTYAMTLTYPVPNAHPGVNQLGFWAWDYGKYVNYLDFRVFADVPIS